MNALILSCKPVLSRITLGSCNFLGLQGASWETYRVEGSGGLDLGCKGVGG